MTPEIESPEIEPVEIPEMTPEIEPPEIEPVEIPEMTPARPRLVATDLDGTLLRTDGTVSDYTRGVLTAVQQAGVPVAIVTARPIRWMADLWPLVGDRGLAVLSNGAVLYDVEQRAVLEVHGLDVEPGLAVVADIRRAVPTAQLGIETVAGIRVEPSYDEPDHVPPGSPVGPLEQVWDLPALKLLVRENDVDPAWLQEAVAGAVGDRAVCTWTTPGLVEISAAGVTKAAGAARLCDRLGLAPADVWAFGDMPNDLPLLAWAGTGCAVANAHPSVLAAADRVVGANDEDGVARELARVLRLAPDLV